MYKLSCINATHKRVMQYVYRLQYVCVCVCSHPHCCLMPPPYTVAALSRLCDENACFINFVTKSMHSIAQQDKAERLQNTNEQPVLCPCQPPPNIPQQHAGGKQSSAKKLTSPLALSARDNLFPSK